MHEIRVLGIGTLHRVGELAQLLRHGIQGDQYSCAAAAGIER